MKNAMWFSRHQPTAEQLAEIEKKGYALVALEQGKAFGARSIDNQKQLQQLLVELDHFIKNKEIHAIFGVFPTPILGQLYRTGVAGIPCYSSWNEREKPLFSHYCWVQIGKWL